MLKKYSEYDHLLNTARSSTITNQHIAKNNSVISATKGVYALKTIMDLRVFDKIKPQLIEKLKEIAKIEKEYQQQRIEKKKLDNTDPDHMNAVEYFANQFLAIQFVWDENGYNSLMQQIQVIRLHKEITAMKDNPNSKMNIMEKKNIIQGIVDSQSEKFKEGYYKFIKSPDKDKYNIKPLRKIIQAIESDEVIVSSGRCNSQELHSDSRKIVQNIEELLVKMEKEDCKIEDVAKELVGLESLLGATESSEHPLEEIVRKLPVEEHNFGTEPGLTKIWSDTARREPFFHRTEPGLTEKDNTEFDINKLLPTLDDLQKATSEMVNNRSDQDAIKGIHKDLTNPNIAEGQKKSMSF